MKKQRKRREQLWLQAPARTADSAAQAMPFPDTSLANTTACESKLF